MTTFSEILAIILVIFYPGAIWISFLAYREFKGMMFDLGGGSNRMGIPMMNRGGQQQQQQQQPYEPPGESRDYSINPRNSEQ